MKYSQATTSLLIASAALATAKQVNEKIMVDDNVQIKQASAAASTATAQFANAPLSTAVVTDANGATVTSYVWWEPSTTAKESAATSAKQSAASSAATSSVKQSSATAKQSTASSAATSAKQSSAAPSATSALFANAPLSTAITTDANGATITSYVWWLPSTTASPSASAHSSAQASAQSSVTSRNWDQPLFTSTYTLVNGAVTTQEIWWVPSVTSNSLVQSSTAADASNVSTSAQTYTSNGSTFTTHTLVTMAAKLNANHSMNTSSAHYTVVNGTTQAINGAGAYKDSMYLAFGAAVIGLLV